MASDHDSALHTGNGSTSGREAAPLRFLQVGMGGMGNTWLRTVQETEGAEFSGFVEVNQAIARDQAAKYGFQALPVYASMREALSADGFDAVINVTPPQFHRDVSCAALEAGIPVLSEKPLADTPEAARDIVRTADRTGVLHVVAQNYRYRPVTQTLRQVTASGELGRVGAVTIEFFRGPHFGGFREEMAYPLIVDMSIHHFDLLRFFLGADPVRVQGRSWNPPWSWFKGDASASVTFDFADGTVATYDGSWCSQGRQHSWNGNWRVECERGGITLLDDAIHVYRPNEEPVPVPLVEMPRSGQAYLLDELCAALRGGPTPATTCQDNIKSLGMVFDTVRAFEAGAPVSAGAPQEASSQEAGND
jgi:predicted dehydrogenase